MIAAYKIDLAPELLPAAGVVVLALVLLATSAFPNYWMLVMALSGFSTLAGVARGENNPSRPSSLDIGKSVSGPSG
jgi:hypothetical protein